MDKNVIAAVVTYNRLDMLKQAIDALRAQTVHCEILVINNGSTDGTKEYLDSQSDLHVVHQENVGGAGGFHTGTKYATEHGYDFAWVMDDDVIPQPDALERLIEDYDYLKEQGEDVGFICSCVKSTDGHIANVPGIDNRPNETGYPDWAKYLSKGIVRTIYATFVSVLIPTIIIREIGLPYREYFIWGDDTEYTKRISQKHQSFMSAHSSVTHLRIGGALNLSTFTDPNRIRMYRLFVRNNFFNTKKYGSRRGRIMYVVGYLLQLSKFTVKGEFSKAKSIASGLISGLTFKPELLFPENPSITNNP